MDPADPDETVDLLERTIGQLNGDLSGGSDEHFIRLLLSQKRSELSINSVRHALSKETDVMHPGSEAGFIARGRVYVSHLVTLSLINHYMSPGDGDYDSGDSSSGEDEIEELGGNDEYEHNIKHV